jgi:hypothetical protein
MHKFLLNPKLCITSCTDSYFRLNIFIDFESWEYVRGWEHLIHSRKAKKKCTVAFSTSIGGLVYGYLKVDMG